MVYRNLYQNIGVFRPYLTVNQRMEPRKSALLRKATRKTDG